ncbi:hypothetical protein HU200_041801 [Digitaria exilis]|uniref:Uncharacterized protein n=1 Tax=Digitaria exilis TaxID=1010633 RepID=A0A835BHA5_9POAL|nr:hypothetical protein HU200_041801 [Digitaria exilis]
MRAIKQGIRGITVHVPKMVFLDVVMTLCHYDISEYENNKNRATQSSNKGGYETHFFILITPAVCYA